MTDLKRAYAVLELGAGASLGQVKHAYRRLARQWHPDHSAADPASQRAADERMKLLNEAYHLLRKRLQGSGVRPSQATQGATYTRRPWRGPVWYTKRQSHAGM